MSSSVQAVSSVGIWPPRDDIGPWRSTTILAAGREICPNGFAVDGWAPGRRRRYSESPWHNGVVSEEPGRAKSSVAVATALVLLGFVITLLSLAPWVRTSSVGGGGENLTGVGLSNSGWLVFAAGALVAATGAVIFATRRAIVAGAAIPAGALVVFVVSSVRQDLREVQGYLRVEGSAAGISSPITRAVHHPIAAIHLGWASRASDVASVLAIGAGVAVIAMWLLRLGRRGFPASLRSARA